MTIAIDDDDDDGKPWNRGVPRETRRAARLLFLEGNRLFRIPVFFRAAEHYRAALAKWKHPAFHFNLALAQLNLGDDVGARDNLERALQHGQAALGPERYRDARDQLEDVTRQLGQLRVVVATEGAEITLDGVTVFVGPGTYQGWATAKAHELTARRSGYLSEARRVVVVPEQVQTIELKLITLSEAGDKNRRWPKWKPWAVIAGGSTIAVAGGALHALSARNFNSYDDEFLQLGCAKEQDGVVPGCTPDDIGPKLNGRLSRARWQQALAVGGYVAGGTMLAAGAVLLYLNRPRLVEQEPVRERRAIAIVPTASADMVGVVVHINR